MLTPYLFLGTIVKPQGLRGEVKLHHEMADPGLLTQLDTLYLKKGETYTPVSLQGARVSGLSRIGVHGPIM